MSPFGFHWGFPQRFLWAFFLEGFPRGFLDLKFSSQVPSGLPGVYPGFPWGSPLALPLGFPLAFPSGFPLGFPSSFLLGFPVGFVGAVESKELLVKQCGIQNQRVALGKTVPFLTLSGRRGGSAMAAAVVNALAKTTKT